MLQFMAAPYADHGDYRDEWRAAPPSAGHEPVPAPPPGCRYGAFLLSLKLELMYELVQLPNGHWGYDDVPQVCANGHPLSGGRVLVSWFRCDCQGGKGHRSYTCRQCEDVTYRPEPHVGSAVPHVGGKH